MGMHSFAILLIAFGLTLISARTLPYSGADFSSILLLEAGNVKYTASSTAAPQPLDKILFDYGVNLARIRVWTSGTYDLTYALKVAKRAKAAGMQIFVTLHYSDTWADPGQQHTPSGWPSDLEGLITQVYRYTHEVVQAFNAQGTPIDICQVGNEVNNGLLWPTGAISGNNLKPVSQLLHAGALAVHDASSSTKVAVQTASGWDKGDVSWFFGGVLDSETEGGLGSGLTKSDVDVMAFSHYPYYGTAGTLSNLNSTMHWVVSTYDKPIIIAETGWPVACDVPLSEPGIPVSTKGQIMWIDGIVAIFENVNLKYPGKALGVVYFEPGWTWNPTMSSPCKDVLLVNSDGVARESLTVFLNM